MRTASTHLPKKPDNAPTTEPMIDRDDHDNGRDGERISGSVEGADQDVATKSVGAEPMRERWRLQSSRDDLQRIDRGPKAHRERDRDPENRIEAPMTSAGLSLGRR